MLFVTFSYLNNHIKSNDLKFECLGRKKIGQNHDSKVNNFEYVYFQYLNKRDITNIGRENFSFSCKIIVGDYILIKVNDTGQKVRNFVLTSRF